MFYSVCYKMKNYVKYLLKIFVQDVEPGDDDEKKKEKKKEGETKGKEERG